MNKKICSVHQPDFFPWLGVFDKIKRSDVFVILDDPQITKTGASYTNRVAFNMNGVAKDFTAPIKRVSGTQNINEVKLISNNWRNKFKNMLQTNYAKSTNFNLYKDRIFELVDFQTDSLCDYNIHAIKGLCDIMDIEYENKIIFSSSLNIKTTSEQRILDICKKLDCGIYFSGMGAKAYQDDLNFKRENIELVYQTYEHPTYKQTKGEDFLVGLSVVDYIFEAYNV